MDHIISREEDVEIDIENGSRFNATQENTTNLVSSEVKSDEVLNQIWSGRLSLDGSEKISDDLMFPLVGDIKPRERSSQSLDLLETKFDNVKFKKTRKPSSKPPRPPKGPLLSANDQKLMREITELAMRKRARIERMKALRRMKANKSSSPCSSIVAMIVTVIFFVFLIFQGFFTGNTSMNSGNSPAPSVSVNNRMVSVQFYNEFAPRERVDPSPNSAFRYMGKRVSGADNEENTRDVNI